MVPGRTLAGNPRKSTILVSTPGRFPCCVSRWGPSIALHPVASQSSAQAQRAIPKTSAGRASPQALLTSMVPYRRVHQSTGKRGITKIVLGPAGFDHVVHPATNGCGRVSRAPSTLDSTLVIKLGVPWPVQGINKLAINQNGQNRKQKTPRHREPQLTWYKMCFFSFGGF